jgi:hypothetical protein
MKKTIQCVKCIGIFLVVITLVACSKEEPRLSSANTTDFRQVALLFAKALSAREYPIAYAMTSEQFRRNHTAEDLKAQFEAIVPPDWGAIGPIEVGQTMTHWPTKQQSDLGWAYVSIGGNVYSEAVIVVVTSTNGNPQIREVEFGRP